MSRSSRHCFRDLDPLALLRLPPWPRRVALFPRSILYVCIYRCKRSASDSGDACGKRSATGQRAIARAVRPAEAGLLWTESAPAQRKTGEHKRCEGSVTYAPHTDASSARAVLVRQAPPPLRRCSAPKNTTCRPFATGVRARPCWAVAYVLTTWLPCGRITSCECLWRS